MDVDAEIARVSSFLGLKWKRLARELGLSPTDVGCIQCDNGDLQDQIHGMFTRWKKREGNKATVEWLYLALEKAGVHEHTEQDENEQLVDAIKEAKDLVGNNWMTVAKNLGFRKTDIDSIVHNHQHCLRSQIDDFFATWRLKNKAEDPWEMCRKLRRVLQDSGLCDGEREAMEVDNVVCTKGCDTGVMAAVIGHECGARVEADGPMISPARCSSSAKGGVHGSKVTPPSQRQPPLTQPQPPPTQPQPSPSQRWSSPSLTACSRPATSVQGGVDNVADIRVQTCDQYQRTPAEMAFCQCSADLQRGIMSPDSIATDLYSAFVLTSVQRDEVQNDALTTDQRTRKLLKFLDAQIKTDQVHFHVFVDILRNEPAYSSLVKKLETAFEKHSGK